MNIVHYLEDGPLPQANGVTVWSLCLSQVPFLVPHMLLPHLHSQLLYGLPPRTFSLVQYTSLYTHLDFWTSQSQLFTGIEHGSYNQFASWYSQLPVCKWWFLSLTRQWLIMSAGQGLLPLLLSSRFRLWGYLCQQRVFLFILVAPEHIRNVFRQ